VAGAGKTFVALHLVLDELRTKKGQVLFVAPSLGLGFHFVRWLMQILGFFSTFLFWIDMDGGMMSTGGVCKVLNLSKQI
jgi:hypothetical protein